MTRARRWLIATLVVAAILCFVTIDRAWDPDDEGALGQSAERVLHGEVPHRDFDELYTGLLSYFHAGAFALGSPRLAVLRIPLFVVTLGWVAAVFALARRLVPPAGAAGLTLLALVWSVPNNSIPMPSWYNLFLATFGALALSRWIEARRSRWLVLAGCLGGLSFLVKLSGLFFLAGAGCFLLAASHSQVATSRPSPGLAAVRTAITLGLALVVFSLWRSIAPLSDPRLLLHFVLPVGFFAAGLAIREWRSPPVEATARIAAVLRVAIPFTLGAVLAIGPYALAMTLAGGLGDTIRGVFITSLSRLDHASMRPPEVFWIIAVAPLLLLLLPRVDFAAPAWRRRGVAVAIILAGALVATFLVYFPNQVIRQSLRGLTPVLGLAAGIVVALPEARLDWSAERRLLVVLLASVAMFTSLIQFPFASPTYFLYVAPMIFLAAAALVRASGQVPAAMQVTVVGFYFAYALLQVLPGSPSGFSILKGKRAEPVPLALARGGNRVPPGDAATYEALVPLAQKHAGGRTIWAGPDAPEVYFLGGFRNPTRALYDFLDPTTSDPGALLALLDREQVRLIVINTVPEFSRPLPLEVLDSLRRRFPKVDTIARFLVRWR